MVVYILDMVGYREGAFSAVWLVLAAANLTMLLEGTAITDDTPMLLTMLLVPLYAAALILTGVWATLQFKWIHIQVGVFNNLLTQQTGLAVCVVAACVCASLVLRSDFRFPITQYPAVSLACEKLLVCGCLPVGVMVLTFGAAEAIGPSQVRIRCGTMRLLCLSMYTSTEYMYIRTNTFSDVSKHVFPTDHYLFIHYHYLQRTTTLHDKHPPHTSSYQHPLSMSTPHRPPGTCWSPALRSTTCAAPPFARPSSPRTTPAAPLASRWRLGGRRCRRTFECSRAGRGPGGPCWLGACQPCFMQPSTKASWVTWNTCGRCCFWAGTLHGAGRALCHKRVIIFSIVVHYHFCLFILL